MNVPPVKPDSKPRAQLFLEEMGLGPIWVQRDSRDRLDAHDPVGGPSIPTDDVVQMPAEADKTGANAGILAGARVDGNTAADSATDLIDIVDSHYARQSVMTMDWSTLKQTVAGCVKCNLCKGRTNTVFGTGDEKAEWLFIGEGPGRNEDLQGEPFIGQAGKLLDNMLLELGVQRGRNAFIANVVKCRPTDPTGRDRPPNADEAGACLPYLQRQIELIGPKVLVALGKTAAISLLGLDPDTPVSKLRGIVHRYGDLPLVVTYHPAYLLRRLTEKSKVWSDLCLAASVHATGAERPGG